MVGRQAVSRAFVLYGSGVQLPVCDEGCAGRWLRITAGSPPARSVVRRIPAPGFCTHCGWCGRIVDDPARCVVHEAAACPRFDWRPTLFAPVVVHDLAKAYGRLSPRAWAYLDEIAGALSGAARWPDPHALMSGMLDRQIDW